MSEAVVDPVIKKAIEHRKFVLNEFVDSERVYVDRLRTTVEGYLNYIKGNSADIPPTLKSDVLSIFSTLPDIYVFHKDVLFKELQDNDIEDPDAMVGVFLNHGAEFTSKYLAYCKNKLVSDSTRLEYDSFFSQRQLALGQKLSIEDLLIAPVQRLPRYQLLIRDLLKDTRKAGLDTIKIEEALDLMQKIPKETNNIICMSLLRGVSRANIISHGSLWRQDTLLFSANGNGSKEEAVQVYLFDHQILVAATADNDGFYHFKFGIKTLNGKVGDDSTDPVRFTFMAEETGVLYQFKADKKDVRDYWITDLRAILTSQLQMKKALMFGKTPTPKVHRHVSIGLDWSGSDSSIDSMPSSDTDSDFEGDWPQETGFQALGSKSTPSPTPANPLKSKKKERRIVEKISNMTSNVFLNVSATSRTSKTFPSHLQRPHSFHAAVVAEYDQAMQKRSESLSVSPRMLRRWFTQKSTSANVSTARIYYPHTSPARSPGAFRKSSKHTDNSPEDVYYIAVDNQPPIASQVYHPHPGQVFLPVDVSRGDVWKAVVLSGDNSGEQVWVQRNLIEEYTAPVLLSTLNKSYSIARHLAMGRFSEVKQGRSKENKKEVALKILKQSTTDDEFIRELCISSRLKHSNIGSCQCGIQDGRLTMVLEHINGRQLLHYLVRKPNVTETMVTELIEQLLDALHYLHSHTIVHLDVRPENIMIQISRRSDVLKLIDFGAARHYGGTTLSLRMETKLDYQYVAPEILKQESFGPGTDIWSVGVIIYTIFHGSCPFNGGSNIRTIANITGLQYSIPSPACSNEAITLIKNIFVLAPRSRPSAESAKSYSWFKTTETQQHNKVDLVQLKRFMQVSKT